MKIVTPTEVITPTESEKLLGALVHQDLKWTEHILNGDDALVTGLTIRLGALKKVCRVATFRNRKMIAEGLIMSKLSYLIPLWAGCEHYILQALQRIQNKAALAQCGWLSVRQLAVYQTCILVFKVLEQKSPQYLYGMFSAEYRRETRQAARLELKADADTPDLDLMVSRFRWRALRIYNQLPAELRKVKSFKSFKPSLWKWIRSNISI